VRGYEGGTGATGDKLIHRKKKSKSPQRIRLAGTKGPFSLAEKTTRGRMTRDRGGGGGRGGGLIRREEIEKTTVLDSPGSLVVGKTGKSCHERYFRVPWCFGPGRMGKERVEEEGKSRNLLKDSLAQIKSLSEGQEGGGIFER